MSAAIGIEGVRIRYAGKLVIDELSLSIKPGEVLALLGPSGSGKTSVLRVILGFVTPETGTVRLDGEVASQEGRLLVLPEERGLAVVFQDLALWPHLSVAGNLAFGLNSRGVPRSERNARIRSILGRVGLTGKEHSHPGELSGGERQRVAIARALVLEPRAVLLDEPLSNLDVGLKRELLSIFRALLKERQTTALYVTHDLREAAALGDRIAVMEQGRVVQEGTLDSLRANPASSFVRTLLNDFSGAGTIDG
ncbi:MAG TPA: ABC transporter ATP-binding protein [Myxococcaceae bacterium]|nr:ABC transporter ATP-binding protein [Myxococcaceae bacterium]